MADPHVDIIAIESDIDQFGRRFFTTHLKGPVLTLTHPTSAESLLDYQLFQKELLLGLGFLYRHAGVECCETITANATWRCFVQGVLLQTALARQQAEQVPLVEQQTPPVESGGTLLN